MTLAEVIDQLRDLADEAACSDALPVACAYQQGARGAYRMALALVESTPEATRLWRRGVERAARVKAKAAKEASR